MARIVEDWGKQDRKAEKAVKASERKAEKREVPQHKRGVGRSRGSNSVGKRDSHKPVETVEEPRLAGLRAACDSKLDAAQAQRFSDLEHAAERVHVFLVARCSQA
jgi:hypothetical protein